MFIFSKVISKLPPSIDTQFNHQETKSASSLRLLPSTDTINEKSFIWALETCLCLPLEMSEVKSEIDSLECTEKAQIYSPTMHLKKALMRLHLKPERETNSFRNVLFIISVDFCRLAARQKRKLFRLVIALHKLSQNSMQQSY